MKLLKNWWQVLRYAWSSRLIILAAILSGIEVVLPLFVTAIPTGAFAIASFIVTAAALVARLVAQPSLHRKPEDGSNNE